MYIKKKFPEFCFFDTAVGKPDNMIKQSTIKSGEKFTVSVFLVILNFDTNIWNFDTEYQKFIQRNPYIVALQIFEGAALLQQVAG